MAVEEKKDDYNRHQHRCLKYDKKSPEPETPSNGKYNYGFPPHITVDELRLYRKGKPAYTWLSNNLKIEEGDFKSLKSEYQRRFKNFFEAINRSLSQEIDVLTVRPLKPEVSLRLEGSHDFQSEYNESFTRHAFESLMRPPDLAKIMDDGVAIREPVTPQIDLHSQRISRGLLKRPTNLKTEGDFFHATEYAEKFIQYLIEKRAELLRTPTTLKLEGDMDTRTENREQYIKYDKPQRAHLCKKFSNLHLEGDRDVMTEKQEKFMPFEVHKRPPLTKKSTNLHLEGDLNLIPEYRRQYVEYKTPERPKLAIPANNLKLSGLFENNVQDANAFHQKMHPLIPFLRDSDKKTDHTVSHRRTSTRSLHLGDNFGRNRNLSESEEARTRRTSYWGAGKSSSQPNLNYLKRDHMPLEGNMDLNPEYRSSYVDYYKDGRISPRVRTRRRSGLDYMTDGSRMDAKPEYRSSYVNFPRQRPHLRKPECHLSSEGENYHVTEKNERFVPHTHIEKTESCKREPELKLEGRFECQPEYRKAYIDYLIREKRPVDQKQRAFQLVCTDDTSNQEEAKENVSEGEQPVAAANEETNGEVEQSTSHLTVPAIVKDSSSRSSVSSSATSTTKPPTRPRKLAQMEESAFGPKLSQKKTQRSLTPSPLPHSGRRSRVGSRDVSPQLVPDLAAMPHRRGNVSPSPAARDTSSLERNRWTNASRSDKAFFVLDDRAPRKKKVATNSLYKEQKWMPSWDYSVE